MKKFYALALSLAVTASSFAYEIQATPEATGLEPAQIKENPRARQLSEAKSLTAGQSKAPKAQAPARVAKDFSTVAGVCGKYTYSYYDYFDEENATSDVTISAVGGESNEVLISGMCSSFVVRATVDVTAGTLTIKRGYVEGSSTIQTFGGTLSGTSVSFLSEFVATLDAENGTITFPADQYFCVYLNGFYCLNSNSVLTAVDESTLVSVTVDQCSGTNKFNISIEKGEKVETIKYIIMPGFWSASAANLAYVASLNNVAPGTQLTYNAATATKGTTTFMIAGVDAEGNLLGGDVAYFYVNDYSTDGWEALPGKAVYGEDYLYSKYGLEHPEYEVTIEKSTKTEGYYRLVNPYGEGWQYSSYNAHGSDHNHYLYIHAEDPAKCYVGESCLGVDVDDEMGMLVATSMVQYYKDNSQAESAYKAYYGTYDETTRTITIPEKALLIQGLSDKGGSLFYANTNNAFKVVLPATDGIKDVISNDNDSAPVEYYNLQGVRIDNPTAGQLVIRRQGTTTSKVLVR